MNTKRPVLVLKALLLSVSVSLLALGCDSAERAPDTQASAQADGTASGDTRFSDTYTEVELKTDLPLSDTQKQLVDVLIEASRPMEAVFWEMAYGDKEAQHALLSGIEDEAVRRFVMANFGPWDRLDGNAPFIEGVPAKPEGANFYPADITREEFERAVNAAREAGNSELAEALTSLYTLVRRSPDGEGLIAIPYSEAFAESFQATASKLQEAAQLAEHPGFKRYLEARAEALVANEYYASDLAWMEMKGNPIDIVIGPIETYEDQLFGYKAAAEAYVLVKDMAWSERLSRYATLLPGLQRGLPVDDAYKNETPGGGAELNAYDVVFVAGDANAGSKTIAINLPNDERVQLEQGTRRLQLKNAMRAKFDKILEPLAGLLIHEDQRAYVTFDAFFGNTMFHEVAHGLGIKNTINDRGTVRKALREHASALEEGKADVLGLYMVTQLTDQGEEVEASLNEALTTFVASIFRSIRFGSSSAHGKANLIRFNFFKERDAFTRDDETGTYQIDFDKTKAASNELSRAILTLQGDGDYDGVAAFVAKYGVVDSVLQGDLDRLASAGIPVDIIYQQP